MLETNNPYMFGSSTTTTTTTSNQSSSQSPSSAPPPSSSSLAGNQNTATSISNNNNNNNNNNNHHHMQQSRPIHHNDNSNNNYFIGKGGEDDYYRNHQQSSRINPTFVRHPEEQQQSSQPPINYTSTYKANKSINNNNNNTNNNIHQHNESEKINNFMRPSVHVYPQQQQQQQQQHIKRELSPNMLTPSTFMKSKKLVEEPDWYERENKSHKPSTPAIITSTTTVTPTPTPTSLSSTSAVAEVSTLEAGDNKKIKRRKEMTGIMEDLNKNFIKKREKLYIEKLNAVNQELKEANQDKHSSYIDGLKDLEMIRKKTIDDGVLFRKYQNEVTDNQFQLEIYQAEEEYTAEIQDIREKLFAGLDEKRRKLKEEKDNCDLAYDVILESQARLHKRNLRKREKEHPENKSSKKKQLTGPALVFKLKDDDILSDIQAMRNGLSSNTTNTALSASTPPKKTNSSNKKK